MNITKQAIKQATTRKIIDLPTEVKRKLSIRAINAGTNLKNYIELICFHLSEYGEFCDDDAQLIELCNAKEAQTKLTNAEKKAFEQYLETFRK
jgi:hypothetical protein